MFWSAMLTAHWSLGLFSQIIFCSYGTYVGWRYYALRTSKEDSRSYLIYNVSTQCLFSSSDALSVHNDSCGFSWRIYYLPMHAGMSFRLRTLIFFCSSNCISTIGHEVFISCTSRSHESRGIPLFHTTYVVTSRVLVAGHIHITISICWRCIVTKLASLSGGTVSIHSQRILCILSMTYIHHGSRHKIRY
jgi:hypothetical protein